MDDSVVRALFSGFSLALTLYVALAPRLARPLYRPFLFHPDPLPHDYDGAPIIDGIAGRDVTFTNNQGRTLHGWLFAKHGTKHFVLVSHGNAGNVLDRIALIRLLLAAGTSVFIYDYQGYGKSEGVPDIPNICYDAMAAYDYLTLQEEVLPKSIVLYGESLGASVACHLSSVRESAAIILQSGFASLQKIAKEELPLLRIYPRWLFPGPALDCVEILKRPHPPVLIAHGVHDAVIPFHHAEHLFNEAIEPKMLLRLPETAHSDITHTAPAEYQREIENFLATVA